VTLDAKEPSKDYQSRGAAALLGTHDGILSLRCGAGKTVVGLHAAAQLGVPILIAVDDKGLAKQWLGEIQWVLGLDLSDIGQMWGGRFDWQKRIAVASVQTLGSRIHSGRLPPEMTRHFGVVLFDEAHMMGAPYFNTAAPPFTGRRWGLSATPNRRDGFDSLLKYTLGPVVYSYLIPDLMPTVYFHYLPTRLNVDDPAVKGGVFATNNKFHYGKCYGYLAREDKARRDRIAATIQLALDAGRQVLVLSHSKDMVDLLVGYFPNGGITRGGVSDERHDYVVKNCNPVIAIMKRGKQALNKPALDTVFITDPFSSPDVLQQTMGRALRSFGGAKKDPKIVFFEDRHIRPLAALCGKLRSALARWPAHKGGRITYKNTT
jgi:superfamily II DNA or RNA helicase